MEHVMQAQFDACVRAHAPALSFFFEKYGLSLVTPSALHEDVQHIHVLMHSNVEDGKVMLALMYRGTVHYHHIYPGAVSFSDVNFSL
jgi:hypothetical protein